MRRTILAVVSLCALAAPAYVAPSSSYVARSMSSASVSSLQDRARFTLGVLRRDGIVIPFAAYGGRRWERPWPEETRFVDVPINLASVPRGWWGPVSPPSTFTVWSGGQSRGEITVGNPTFVATPCGRRIGLRTNYRPAVPPPPALERPYPKDGLVVSGSQRVEAVQDVPRDSPEWRLMAVKLLDEFDRQENIAAGSFTRWRHPVPRAQRRKVPVQLEALYRAPMDEPDAVAYYAEAVKQYPAQPGDDDCGLLTFARGWLAVIKGDVRSIELFAQVTYCDRTGASFMLPLGIVRAGRATHWVYQISGYERETYLISRPTPDGVTHQAGYSAGFCSQ